MAPQKGKARCWFHDDDPAVQKARDAARLKGGEARVQLAGGRAAIRKALGRKSLEDEELLKELGVEDVKFERAGDVTDLLALTAKLLLTGRVAPDISSAIASLANVALRALKEDNTDDRLKKLEEQTRVLKGLAPETLLELLRKAREARGAATGH